MSKLYSQSSSRPFMNQHVVRNAPIYFNQTTYVNQQKWTTFIPHPNQQPRVKSTNQNIPHKQSNKKPSDTQNRNSDEKEKDDFGVVTFRDLWTMNSECFAKGPRPRELAIDLPPHKNWIQKYAPEYPFIRHLTEVTLTENMLMTQISFYHYCIIFLY